MTIGELVKEFRIDNNLTMEEFAKRANLSKGYISMLEKDCNPKTKKGIVPTFSTLKLIASAMDIDVNSLISALDEKQPILWNDKDDIQCSAFFIDFADRLKQLRINRGFTSKEISQHLGIAPSLYSQYENGKRQPDLHKIYKLIEILSTTGDYLIGLSDAPQTTLPGQTGEHLFLSTTQRKILSICKQLNEIGQKKVLDFCDDLLSSYKYSALGREPGYKIAAYGADETEEDY